MLCYAMLYYTILYYTMPSEDFVKQLLTQAGNRPSAAKAFGAPPELNPTRSPDSLRGSSVRIGTMQRRLA